MSRSASSPHEDTIIVFSSDHGEMLGDFGTMGKRSMLDAAVHIPCMIRVPGMAGTRRSDVCSLVDIAPTLLSLSGISYQREAYDGIDLFGPDRHDAVYSQYSTGKTGTYLVAAAQDKLVYSAPCREFYYFDTIPERRNQYDERNPRVRELRGLLEAYMSGDVGQNGSGDTDAVSGRSKFPYGPKRADHLMRRGDEAGRMPEGYPIDL